MIVLQATTPANGLNPPVTNWYLSQFDAATQGWMTTTVINPPEGWTDPTAVAFTSGAIDVEDGQYGTDFGRLAVDGTFLGTHAAPTPSISGVGTPTASGLALVVGTLENSEANHATRRG